MNLLNGTARGSSPFVSAPEERMLCDRSTYKVAHAQCTKTGVVRELTLSRMCPDISGMKLSSCDVTSCNGKDLWRSVLLQ